MLLAVDDANVIASGRGEAWHHNRLSPLRDQFSAECPLRKQVADLGTQLTVALRFGQRVERPALNPLRNVYPQ